MANDISFKKKGDITITPELITRFVLGSTTADEWFAVSAAMREDPKVREHVRLTMELNADLKQKTPMANPQGQTVCKTYAMVLPIATLAASSDANDCVVRCEQFVLERHGRKSEYETLRKEALSRDWLREKGTPLFNIGRTLELATLSVARKFNGSLKTVSDELAAGCSVIVALNTKALTEKTVSEDVKPDHAVVVLETDEDNGLVSVFDPQWSPSRRTLRTKDFMRAWRASKKYFVSITERGVRPYKPHPEPVSQVKLPEEIIPVADMLAENAHDIWAIGRLAEYKKQREKGLDVHPENDPYMKPFHELTKKDRKSDYLTALNTIKLIHKLGFTITPPKNTASFFKSNKRTKDGKYIPNPINLDGVTLPDELTELTEYLAENAHEEWAKLRISEGWTFAPVTNKALKQSFDLIPYCELLDSEKEYDRKMAMNTLRLLYKIGCRINKRQCVVCRDSGRKTL